MAGLRRACPRCWRSARPSPASYLRLQPSRWAGAYQVWGAENREAAVRFIESEPGRPGAANVELKCFDLSANPYLLTGAVLAVALAHADSGEALPDEFTGDPAAGLVIRRQARPSGCRAAWLSRSRPWRPATNCGRRPARN